MHQQQILTNPPAGGESAFNLVERTIGTRNLDCALLNDDVLQLYARLNFFEG